MVKIKIDANIKSCGYKIKNLDVVLKDVSSFEEIDEDHMSIRDSNKLIERQVFTTYGIPIENIKVHQQLKTDVKINSCMDNDKRNTFKYGVVNKIINIINGKLYED